MLNTQKNEMNAFKAMNCAKDLNDYYEAYLGVGCDVTQYSRFHRIYEIRLIQDVIELKRLARHHIIQAEKSRSMPWWMDWEENLTRKCKYLREQPHSLLDRVAPACEALEKLGLDPNGECRAGFYEILRVLDQAFDRVEVEITHLSGKAQLEAKWSRYHTILVYWRRWYFSPFISRFNAILSEVERHPGEMD